MSMENIDVSGFEDVLGLKFDPISGEVFKPYITWGGPDGDQEITTWSSTGWTFLEGYIVGPGVRTKSGILAYATKDTADKAAAFVSSKVVPKHKVEIVDVEWTGFRVIDAAGKSLPQYQLKITSPDGITTFLNAGLVANQIIRSGPEFAAEMLRFQIS